MVITKQHYFSFLRTHDLLVEEGIMIFNHLSDQMYLRVPVLTHCR